MAGIEEASPFCGGILNAEQNAQRHSRPDYDSNGAANATTADYIVDLTPTTPVLIRTNVSVEWGSVQCNHNSGDYKFCALQALFGDEPDGAVETQIQCLQPWPNGDCLKDNRYARNISTARTSSPGKPIVEFQAEAFVECSDWRLGHKWLCMTEGSTPPTPTGYTGTCAMYPWPDVGANLYISQYAVRLFWSTMYLSRNPRFITSGFTPGPVADQTIRSLQGWTGH